jgi:hypothetical protein
MIKTQVQIPDELYQKAKQIAKDREWSLAEVMRRGLEYMAQTHQPLPANKVNLPVLPSGSFIRDFDDLDLKALAEEDETARSLQS